MSSTQNSLPSPSPSELVLKPIGYFSSEQKEPYQTSRQPDELAHPGFIQLIEKNNFEQALQDLAGCTHVWIIFQFHKNPNWKPLVLTPRTENKIGVFATRSPYRPNPIGLSAVELISIDGLKITIGPNDILDGTPIFDIKPYHPQFDVIPQAQIKWLEEQTTPLLNVQFSPYAESQIDFLESNGVFDLKNFLLRQLSTDPFNKNKKRVKKISPDLWELSYRTWRADFLQIEETITVMSLRTGYSIEDLNHPEDPYQDKKIHQKFLGEYKS